MCALFFAEQRQYDLRENVPCFASLLQAEHHQKGARTEVPLQVSAPYSLSSLSSAVTTCTLIVIA